uniref:Uncharacterized protein n=1 Tax=Candidatus Methanogaster sp. ANME-2c ERB4 TaxID=2759911 RepID=A0A7G9Y2L8_9EURY|nr:hypothetical protein LDHBDEKG_00003 [Methanosarcinales archaeon ANME-2c ERB4]QNO43054.1 hypothetical protein HGKCJMEE_00032 [Methanosarcinales archaeon ANME-2c ERB4]QNO43181.1 hypothetical protein CEGDBGHB_00003 [Methanosarcinales archaeon ANME-2c ERB4]QNO45350.1 hypothetical protein IOFJOFCH_00010 [Methanosarcinales archaeon ANME-2c ERB4]QNO45680.1 hypothetical protein BOCBCOEP_00009 [Methanosarcinales archaeon ANME-2c ERB4]
MVTAFQSRFFSHGRMSVASMIPGLHRCCNDSYLEERYLYFAPPQTELFLHKCQLDVQHERRDNAKTIKNKNPPVGDHVIWTSWALVAMSFIVS